MLFVQLSPSQLRHVALLSSAEVYINRFLLYKRFFCNHIQTAFFFSVAIWLLTERDITSYHLFTCYVTNAGVGSDQISVWDFFPQLHPVTVTVEVLQVHKRKWRLRSSELFTRVKKNSISFKTMINTWVGWQISPSFCLAASKLSCLMLAFIARSPSVMMFLPWTNISSSKWKLALRAWRMSTRTFISVMKIMAWRKLLDDFGAPQATATAFAV